VRPWRAEALRAEAAIRDTLRIEKSRNSFKLSHMKISNRDKNQISGEDICPERSIASEGPAPHAVASLFAAQARIAISKFRCAVKPRAIL
jgi:hypothetical protein